MQIAILGLAGMGKIVIDKLLEDSHELVIWNNSKEELERIRSEKADFIVNQKLKIVHSIEELQNVLRKPIVMWISAPVGEPTESMIAQVSQIISAGDIVIDGGNSNYKDTQRRFEDFEKRGLKFLGIGIEGGIHAVENGCALMVGGNFDAYQYINPVRQSLIKPNGAESYFGPGGAGHFVNMVHKGVEAGMMQGIAEGLSLLNKSDYDLDLVDVVNTWQGGGTVSSFLLDMVMDGLENDPALTSVDGILSTNQSVRWMIDDAKSKGLNVPVIAQAFDFESRSQYDKIIAESFAALLIQTMKKEIRG